MKQKYFVPLILAIIAAFSLAMASIPASAGPKPAKPTTTTALPVQPDAVSVSPALPTSGTCVGEVGVPNGSLGKLSVAGPKADNKLSVTSTGLLQYRIAGYCQLADGSVAPFSLARTVTRTYSTTASSITFTGLTVPSTLDFGTTTPTSACYGGPTFGCADYLTTAGWTGSVTYTAHTSAELAALSTFQASAKTPADFNALINALAN